MNPVTNTCDYDKSSSRCVVVMKDKRFVCFVVWGKVGFGMYVVPIYQFLVIVNIIINNCVVLLE